MLPLLPCICMDACYRPLVILIRLQSLLFWDRQVDYWLGYQVSHWLNKWHGALLRCICTACSWAGRALSRPLPL